MTTLRTDAQQALDREDIIRMAREAGAMFEHMAWVERDLFPVFARFAALVAAAEREILADWMRQHGFSTGQAYTTATLLDRLGTEMVENTDAAVLEERAMIKKPLGEDQMNEAYIYIWRNLPDGFDHTASAWIETAIRYAERAHGIGGEA